MNQPAKAQEPSMEEILASIRRIIADDDAGKPQKPEPAPVKPSAAAPAAAAKPAVPEPAAMSQDDIDAMLSTFDPPPPRRQAVQPAPRPDPHIMSAETSAAVDAAFNTLAQTVLVHNAKKLEDLVREMLRPMLKSWLDDNLPNM